MENRLCGRFMGDQSILLTPRDKLFVRRFVPEHENSRSAPHIAGDRYAPNARFFSLSALPGGRGPGRGGPFTKLFIPSPKTAPPHTAWHQTAANHPVVHPAR